MQVKYKANYQKQRFFTSNKLMEPGSTCTEWGLVRHFSEEVFDLLGEVAAKSSYSKVLVGEWSGRPP